MSEFPLGLFCVFATQRYSTIVFDDGTVVPLSGSWFDGERYGFLYLENTGDALWLRKFIGPVRRYG